MLSPGEVKELAWRYRAACATLEREREFWLATKHSLERLSRTEQKQAAQLEILAARDPLTGALNRRGFASAGGAAMT